VYKHAARAALWSGPTAEAFPDYCTFSTTTSKTVCVTISFERDLLRSGPRTISSVTGSPFESIKIPARQTQTDADQSGRSVRWFSRPQRKTEESGSGPS
jgi:hypothetical protein